jgi:hypothetical protein
VPHKLRKNLTGAAQFLENFKHRKIVKTGMTTAFRSEVGPTALHRHLASLDLPLIVNAWYDDLAQKALAVRPSWGVVQGVSQAEHVGQWTHWFDQGGMTVPAGDARIADWTTLLYQPLGSVAPAANYLVSDSDFVEVLTEIDIQSPIPARVQELRRGRGFVFLGCRFAAQLERIFARQIMKRSADRHWAVLPGAASRNELRFLAEMGIERIDAPLAAVVEALVELTRRSLNESFALTQP